MNREDRVGRTPPTGLMGAGWEVGASGARAGVLQRSRLLTFVPPSPRPTSTP